MTGGATFGLIAGGCHNAWAMTEDRITEPAWARRIAQSVGTTAIELPGSHSPFLSRPGLLADTLVGLV